MCDGMNDSKDGVRNLLASEFVLVVQKIYLPPANDVTRKAMFSVILSIGRGIPLHGPGPGPYPSVQGPCPPLPPRHVQTCSTWTSV